MHFPSSPQFLHNMGNRETRLLLYANVPASDGEFLLGLLHLMHGISLTLHFYCNRDGIRAALAAAALPPRPPRAEAVAAVATSP